MILNGLFLILIFDLEMLLKVIVFVLFRDICFDENKWSCLKEKG